MILQLQLVEVVEVHRKWTPQVSAPGKNNTEKNQAVCGFIVSVAQGLCSWIFSDLAWLSQCGWANLFVLFRTATERQLGCISSAPISRRRYFRYLLENIFRPKEKFFVCWGEKMSSVRCSQYFEVFLQYFFRCHILPRFNCIDCKSNSSSPLQRNFAH